MYYSKVFFLGDALPKHGQLLELDIMGSTLNQSTSIACKNNAIRDQIHGEYEKHYKGLHVTNRNSKHVAGLSSSHLCKLVFV